jgi:hypothetical protein
VKFSFQHPAGGLTGSDDHIPAVFELEVTMGFDGGLGEEEGVANVAFAYEKLAEHDAPWQPI